MPLNPTNPNTDTVPVPVSKPINHIHVTRLEIHTPLLATDPTEVSVEWHEGHDDGAGTVSYKPQPRSVHIYALPTDPDNNPHGNELLALMASATTGASLYATIKAGVYQLLIDCNLVPEGAVS